MDVFKWNPPLIFIEGVHGAFGRGMQLCLLEPTLGASEELSRIKVEAVGLWALSVDYGSRSACPGLQPPPTLVLGLSRCPLS